MKQDPDLGQTVRPIARTANPIKGAYAGLSPLVSQMRQIENALSTIADNVDETGAMAIAKLRGQIRSFEPSVTMIGQVKAGKTTLVNAMIGRPGLLPADINPWTSVVTSLHMSPTRRAAGQKARFRFFSEEEWEGLLSRGGRVGELAARAGADKELEKVRQQLEVMREKSRQRLGRKFEMLLGQEHEYSFVDEALIKRYVCLGDAFDSDETEDPDQAQGRFADITRSADLYMDQAALPLGVCVRDTPGVNDTFMVREQITVSAIRASRLCVVVLSAHQALSTVDMALIRMISNIKSREVIIFVNRVDELTDPARDIPEIRDSIRATLKAQDGPVDAQIIFGSAFWASQVLEGKLHALGRASAEALINLAEDEVSRGLDMDDPKELAWALSGLPTLGKAVSDRIVAGEGGEFVKRIAGTALNIVNSVQAADAVSALQVSDKPVVRVPREEAEQRFDAVADAAYESLHTTLAGLEKALADRLERSRQTFLGRATTSLIEHLENNGEDAIWTYDPAGLRALLRSGYRVFSTKSFQAGTDAFATTSRDIEALIRGAFGLDEETFSLTPASVPPPPVPVMLGQTIALDIKGNWWTRWWRRRRSYDAFAEEFSALIDAEIEPMVTGLSTGHAQIYKEQVCTILDEFLETQRANLLNLASRTEADLNDMRKKSADEIAERARNVKTAKDIINRLETDPDKLTDRGAVA